MTVAIRFLLLLIAGVAAFSQAPDRKPDLDRIFAAFTRDTAGCTVGVSLPQQPAITAAYGMADLERSVPITVDTVFESGSVAKQFTAFAVLLLAQQGKINLQDPVRKYVPELPDYGTNPTIWQAIHHTAGFREWSGLAEWHGAPRGTRAYSMADLLDLASRQRRLNFMPGSEWSYSNTGFALMPFVIERASGKTFQTYMQEYVFGPLGMTHTRWRSDYRDLVKNRALPYMRTSDGFRLYWYTEHVVGPGGLLTTISDLLKWNQNLDSAQVGGRELLDLMHKTEKLSDGYPTNYAGGLQVESWQGLREVNHSGSTGGYRTWSMRFPEKQMSVAVLCNSNFANPEDLARKVAKLWLPEPVSANLPNKPAAAPSGDLAHLAGTYRNSRSHEKEVVQWRDNQLWLHGTPLTPISEGRFQHGGSRITFTTPTRFSSTGAHGITYEKIPLWTPKVEDVLLVAGEYSSEEVNNKLRIEADGLKLKLYISKNQVEIYEPTFPDTFEFAGQTLRIVRDPEGTVIGIRLSTSQLWDLLFSKLI